MSEMDFSRLTTEQLEQTVKAAKRQLAVEAAKDSLMGFLKLMNPDPEDLDDPDRSQYQETPQARLLCEVMEKVARGEMLRVCVSIGPQLGKSEIISRKFPAWHAGKFPHKHLMLATYNQDFANEFGGEVRAIMNSDPFKQVFPKFGLRFGNQGKELLVTNKGGKMAFVGVGGSGSGKPADIFVIDDPIKNDDDVQSPAFRAKLWSWFNKVSFARCHKFSAIVIVHTRWHEDDLIGRLVDPEHPEHDPQIAKNWTYINIPAVVHDEKLATALGLTLQPPVIDNVISQFGPRPVVALWEDRKGLTFLAEARRLDNKGFDALYMGKPSPDDGDYFKREMLVEYQPWQLPKNLRKYGASDHAVTEKQTNDASVAGCVGIDENDDIWVLPDVVWARMESDELVEQIVAQMKLHKPMLWWAEDDVIRKAIGPFLRTRMKEEKAYCAIDPTTPSKSKTARAASIKGRMSMQKVHFPAFVSWWQEAKAQILRFPNATHDDFVDWLAHIGLGLTKEISASPEAPKNQKVVAVGSIEWVKARAARERRQEELQKAAGGF